jgi:hypothetical protein
MNDISELAGIDRQRFGDSLNFPGQTALDCRLFVEVPNRIGIMQECITFQLIWISLERTADCEICGKREQL